MWICCSGVHSVHCIAFTSEFRVQLVDVPLNLYLNRLSCIVQVGAGLGLPAIAASVNANSVIATDWSQQAMDALDEAVAFNRRANSSTKHLFGT